MGRQGAGESMNPPFGHGVVEQIFVAKQTGDRSRHNDCATGFHVRHSGPCHIKIPIQICFYSAVKVLVTEVFEIIDVFLKGSIVDKNVELTEAGDGTRDRLFAKFWISYIA